MFKIEKLTLDQLKEDFITEIYCLELPTKSYESENAELSEDGSLRIKKGFKWNYCTPQFRIHFGRYSFRVGTWNGKKVDGKVQTWEASLVHDVLYEDSHLHEISRDIVDYDFWIRCLANGFSLGWVYYILIRVFGWSFWKKKKSK